ncbi:HAD-IIIC family phosphatase [Nocardia thailandica]
MLALEHGRIPGTVNVRTPSPQVDWAHAGVAVRSRTEPWPRGDRPRRAGVSAFGLSGTNAHLILEEAAPAPAEPPREPAGTVALLPISARSETSLHGQARRLLARVLSDPTLTPSPVSRALVVQRTPFERRAVLVAADRDAMIAALDDMVEGRSSADVVIGSGPVLTNAKTAFVFPGQGMQWVGMARDLLPADAEFRDEFARCDAAFGPHLGWSLTERLTALTEADLIDFPVVQPLLFATMAALAASWRAVGVTPDAVVGHSQGEIAAAYCAGALDLDTAARIVVTRSRLMSDLDEPAAMAMIGLPEPEVAARLGALDGRVSVAAVNVRRSTIVAGEQAAVAEPLADLDAAGIYTRLGASGPGLAGHCRMIEAIRDPFTARLADLVADVPTVAWYSTVTGEPVTEAQAGPGYWYRNARDTVRFAATVERMIADGFRYFVELGAHPSLTAAVQAAAENSSREIVAVGSLVRDQDGPTSLARARAALYAGGHDLDWSRLIPGTGRIDLPTYAFDERRFWTEGARRDTAALGLDDLDHPVLGAAVPHPDSDGVTLTGRLTRARQPWVADHAGPTAVLIPGAALVEWAVRAGDEVGCPVVRDLVLRAPLLVPDHAALRIQVVVGGEAGGRRSVRIHARDEREPDAPWTLHAEGTVSGETDEPAGTAPGSPVAAAWPPVDAEPVDTGDLYARLAARGHRYGPVFQGVRAIWRRGEDLFAEIELAEQARADAARFGIHPALLDAALHPTALHAADGDHALLPFAWSDVVLSATGATALRVRLTRSGPDTVTLAATDRDGRPVISVGSLLLRPVDAAHWRAAAAASADRHLFRLTWHPAAAPEAVRPRTVARWDHAGPGTAEVLVLPVPEGEAPAEVHDIAQRVLADLQTFLGDRRFERSTLVVHTRRAVATGDPEPGGPGPDPAGAVVWGLVRSAQSENPGRIVLLDSADPAPDFATLPALDEPQIAVRDGHPLVPRLARRTDAGPGRAGKSSPSRGFGPGAVLVTGAPGRLGSALARHLADAHEVRDLVLVSRRGIDGPGGAALRDELEGRGVRVRFAACDLTDRAALAALLDGLPLAGVVHAACVLDDATLGSLTPAQLTAVLRPKVDAAWHLHELTAECPPAVFVLFSAAGGLFGTPGQANYAAANAYLDALALRRRSLGLPAQALAWGAWDVDVHDHLARADIARIARAGVRAFPVADGMACFDAALAHDDPFVVPLLLDTAALRESPAVPPLLRGLVRRTPRRATAGSAAADAVTASRLVQDLRAAPRADAVAAATAALAAWTGEVLGHTEGERVPTEKSFHSLGLDSLMAVELRNKVREHTGVTVPLGAILAEASLTDLAGHLVDQLGEQGDGAAPGDPAEASGVPEVPEAPEVPEVEVLPVTANMMRLLRTEQLGIPGAAQTGGVAVRVPVRITPDRLDRALAGLARRHAALRAGIRPGEVHGRELVIRRAAVPTATWRTLDHLDDAVAREHFRALLAPPFDLAAGPLWRFELLDAGSGQILLVGAHHSMSDVQSMLLVAGELAADLAGTPLADTVSNRDLHQLVAAQPTRRDDGAAARWQAAFAGARRLDLTLASPRPAARSYRGEALALDLPAGLHDRVAERARELGITPAAVFLGALAITLARLRQVDRFALAVPVDTRMHADATGAVGYFGVPVPFPATVAPGDRVGDVLRRTGDGLRALLAPGAGFAEMLAALAGAGLHRDGAPLVEVYFNYLRANSAVSAAEIVPVGTGFSDLDLMVAVLPDTGRVWLTYNTDIIDEPSCAALGRDYLAAVAAAVADPGAPARPETGAAESDSEIRVALGATFALGHLTDLLAAAATEVALTVAEAPYHHVLSCLRDPSGVFAQDSTDLGVVLVRGADLERFGEVTDDLLAELADEFPAAVRDLVDRTRRPLVVGFPPQRRAGERFAAWERLVADRLREVPGVAVLDGVAIAAAYPVAEPFDERTEILAHLPFTPEYQAAMALTLAATVTAAAEPAPKVIVVDGDDTLWSGTAGEIGAARVGFDAPRRALAARLRQWRDAGTLLVLLSSNDDDIVRAVLDRPDSPLGYADFAVVATGWATKPERLASVVGDLGLALDTVCYLDDNPVEIARMRATLPEVLSVTCPPAAELEALLTRLWPAVPLATTAEDRARADFYRADAVRDDARATMEFEQFLAGLDLEVRIEPLTEDTVARAHQLVRRTTQFALGAVTVDDFERGRAGAEVWTATARDRFGDYGLISVLTLRADAEAVTVTGWHLSCRAFGRGIEERLLARIADHADTLGRPTVHLTVEPTARNTPARRLAARLRGDDDWDGPQKVSVTPDRLRAFRSWRTPAETSEARR